MKKILTILVCGIIILELTGCSKEITNSELENLQTGIETKM
ncbi:MAG: hypothetical protein PUC82_05110 [bacterium]|nr:hypothetical protein [bacterium]